MGRCWEKSKYLSTDLAIFTEKTLSSKNKTGEEGLDWQPLLLLKRSSLETALIARLFALSQFSSDVLAQLLEMQQTHVFQEKSVKQR